MVIRASGDLRQVGDAQYLPPLPKLLQHAADGRRDCAADAGVDFVEDQCRQLANFGQHDLDRQSKTRQLTTGRDAGERPQRLLGVGGNLQLDSLETETGRFGNGDQGNLDPATGHRQPLHHRTYAMSELRRGKLAFCR